MEQKNNDRIEKMREEMENKLEMILKEIKSNKSASTVTNPGSETNENRDPQPSGSKTNRSIGVHASNNENSDSENDDYPLRASKMKDLRHPARPIFHNESDVDVTINPEDESDAEEVEDYHIPTSGVLQIVLCRLLSTKHNLQNTRGWEKCFACKYFARIFQDIAR